MEVHYLKYGCSGFQAKSFEAKGESVFLRMQDRANFTFSLFLKVMYFILEENFKCRNTIINPKSSIFPKGRAHSGGVLKNFFSVSPSSTYSVHICYFLFKGGTMDGMICILCCILMLKKNTLA